MTADGHGVVFHRPSPVSADPSRTGRAGASPMWRSRAPAGIVGVRASCSAHLHSRLLEWRRRHGTGSIVLVTTLLSVVISLALTGVATGLVYLAGNLTRERFITTMLIGLFGPLLTTPLASQLLAGLLTELDRVNRQLCVQSRTDVLTEVYNRRGFFDQAQPLAVRTSHEDVVLCMVDVNRFKQLNDEYGHDVGDRALAHLASLMTRVVGCGGIVGRLGGDEFALLIPGQQDTASFRDRLREVFQAVELPSGPVISASCGVTQLVPGDSLDGALTRADMDLYQSKAALASSTEFVRTPPTPRSMTRVEPSQPSAQTPVRHRARHRRP